MKVRVQTKDGIELPKYESNGACAFDLATPIDLTFPPRGFLLVDTKIVVEIPKGYALQLHARSSTFKKHSLLLANGVAIIDNDYCGPDDTLKLALLNWKDEEVVIPAGTRLGQGMFVAIGYADFEPADLSDHPTRGGFGSTGL